MNSETGVVEKIQIITGVNKDIDNIVLKNVETWKFSLAQKNGKAVKSQYHWRFFNGAEVSFEIKMIIY